MCVTRASLWNTPLLEVLRCGHRSPVKPHTLGVRAVDRHRRLWTGRCGKTCRAILDRALVLGVRADLLQFAVDLEDHHERLKDDPVHAERDQNEERVDDDERRQRALPPAGVVEEDEDADRREPDRL